MSKTITLSLEDILQLQQSGELTTAASDDTEAIQIKYAGGTATVHRREYLDKEELVQRIDDMICRHCRYHNIQDDKSHACDTCKVSLVYAAIALGTPCNYLYEDMIPIINSIES